MFLIEGIHLLYEALKSGLEVIQIYVRSGDETDPGILDALRLAKDTSTVLFDRDLFDSLADTVTPQGVMAAVRRPNPPAQMNGSALVIDRLQDPGNVGSIVRSADAAGIETVIAVKGTADIYSRKVLRAAAGALFRIHVFFAEDAETALTLLRENDIKVFACDMKGAIPYHSADLTGRIGIVIGNEGGGLSETFLSGDTDTIYIPMEPESESLNASVTAAIVMFEKRRQDGR
jgi:TrmH family RNA methyltransferase